MMAASRCPCCNSDQTEDLALRHTAYGCRSCGHQWKRENLPEIYYVAKAGRNPVDSTLKRKIDERIAALSPMLYEGMRILDIGCAEGSLGAAIKQHIPVQITGIELSEDAQLASSRLDAVVRQPAAQLDVPPFDLILAFHVLEHIADPATEVRHWRRLLKPEGTMVIETPHRAGHPWLSADRNPEHLHCFSCASLLALLQACGLETRTLSTNRFESPVYPDGLHVIATHAIDDATRRQRLIARFLDVFPEGFVVYCAGGDFRNYVEPLIDALPIAAICDTNATIHGQLTGTHAITAYDFGQHSKYPVLIASLHFKQEIATFLQSQGLPSSHIFGLDDIYGNAG